MRPLLNILLGLLVLPWASSAQVIRNGLVAIVNDAIITRQELMNYTAQSVDLLQRTFANQPEVLQQRFSETIKDGMDQLVERQLILDDFKTLGGELPESVIDDRIKEIIRQTYGDRASLTRTLKSRGTTYEDFRKQTRDDIIIRYMRDHNVASAILISPAKIERYYTNHIDQFQLGDQVKLRMLELSRTAGSSAQEIARLAHEIHTKVSQGASFGEMAAIYSEGPSRREGGDWGWVEKTKLNQGLAEVAFSLRVGQLSDILSMAREAGDSFWICYYNGAGKLSKARKFNGQEAFQEEKTFEDPGGDPALLPPPQKFYMMVVEAKRVARTQSIDEVRDGIEKELIVEERARLQRRWIDRLKDKSFIRYFSLAE